MNTSKLKLFLQSCIALQNNDLEIKLSNSERPLIVKFGCDPTAPDLHLGHCIILEKLKYLQNLGHKIIFVIGDFTALIGDPTGRDKSRIPLSVNDIKKNMKTYAEQVFSVLKPELTEIRYNSEWFNGMQFETLIKILSNFTIAQLMQRDDFYSRQKNHLPIRLHEILYPLLQAYDSVILKADIECGGQDQMFNLLLARELQRFYDQTPQSVLLGPIIPGIDGQKKMSKSLNNYIGINDSNMYGKLMSIPDHLLSIYQNQFFWETPIDYTNISGKDLMQAKKKFAFDMVCKYQNESEAKLQEAKFLSITASKSCNLQVSNYEIEKQAISSNKSSMMIAEIIYNLNIKDYSKSHVKRLINSGAVKVNDIVVNINFTVNINSTVKIKIGKQREYSVTIVGTT